MTTHRAESKKQKAAWRKLWLKKKKIPVKTHILNTLYVHSMFLKPVYRATHTKNYNGKDVSIHTDQR